MVGMKLEVFLLIFWFGFWFVVFVFNLFVLIEDVKKKVDNVLNEDLVDIEMEDVLFVVKVF